MDSIIRDTVLFWMGILIGELAMLVDGSLRFPIVIMIVFMVWVVGNIPAKIAPTEFMEQLPDCAEDTILGDDESDGE